MLGSMLDEREVEMHCNCPKYGHSGLVGSFNAFGNKDANENNNKIDFCGYTEKGGQVKCIPPPKGVVDNW